MLAILHFFTPCEIMHPINGFMEIKKEFWLLQALAILKHSVPIDMQNIFEFMLLDFLGILTILKGNLSFIKKSYSKVIIFYLDVQIQKSCLSIIVILSVQF